MIEFDCVKYQYHYDDFAIFENLSFTLIRGVNTILCGEQSGKSTICKLLCNQITPNSGKITLDGISINATKDNGVLYLPQKPVFFENKSVLFNIAYPLQVRKTPQKQRLQKALEIANFFELPTDVKVKTLTAQEKTKLALARALTVERKVALFDDFFDSVDQMQGVLQLFPDTIKVVLTSRPSLAVGNVVVVDKHCVFQGERDKAVQFAQDIVSIVKE